MTNPPRVSICIPTYNGREHLKECLDCVRAQSFQNFEVVICDDQSSDGTLNYARELTKGDERFRFISNRQRFGLVGNWNNCIRVSRGEWIKFVFQDDIIAPTCVEMLLHACKQTGKSFGFCARDFIFEHGVSEALRNWFAGHKQRLQSDYQSSLVVDPESAARIVVCEPTHNLVGEPTVTLINRSVFRELGNFDEALIQISDAEFWSRVMVNKGAVLVRESMAAFRIHAKATTALNHGKRAYRMGVLDTLVIRYRIAFDRHFKPVRNPQLTGKSILSLRTECAAAAAHAWKEARLSITAKDRSSFDDFTEWKSVISHCRGLQVIAQWGRVINLYRKVKKAVRGEKQKAAMLQTESKN
jgi:glycosyltransferase involved in cell wall biosynthesis